ncbi:hypothetical protein PTTG_26784 [Puccinia triticina 1-1 BBBD Race 1]|uniref:Uncharacterized protein n=1 Tax=Puccinia triticina (isolate 1-1 / race 1 (BBBD)) TaxID=630390 RepID=A0A180GRL8_PUCT1|nr:hypothetical protein PTTG_26784 [Puccinia triticina 1-1 BBBD Race 1]WAR63887.1 hypothetical protein PtB15_16B46 [Puccinia triticina]
MFPPHILLPIAPPPVQDPPTVACVSNQMIHLFLVLQEDAHLIEVTDEARAAQFALAALQTSLRFLAQQNPNDLISPQLRAVMDETIRMALEAQNQALLAQIQAFIQASEARTGLLIAELEGRVNQHITNSISAAETRINTHMATKIRESEERILARLAVAESVTNNVSDLINSIAPAINLFIQDSRAHVPTTKPVWTLPSALLLTPLHSIPTKPAWTPLIAPPRSPPRNIHTTTHSPPTHVSPTEYTHLRRSLASLYPTAPIRTTRPARTSILVVPRATSPTPTARCIQKPPLCPLLPPGALPVPHTSQAAAKGSHHQPHYPHTQLDSAGHQADNRSTLYSQATNAPVFAPDQPRFNMPSPAGQDPPDEQDMYGGTEPATVHRPQLDVGGCDKTETIRSVWGTNSASRRAGVASLRSTMASFAPEGWPKRNTLTRRNLKRMNATRVNHTTSNCESRLVNFLLPVPSLTVYRLFSCPSPLGTPSSSASTRLTGRLQRRIRRLVSAQLIPHTLPSLARYL